VLIHVDQGSSGRSKALRGQALHSLQFQPAGGCIAALEQAVGIDAVMRSAGLQARQTAALTVMMRCNQFDSGRNMCR
jgi:hypothetical protein